MAARTTTFACAGDCAESRLLSLAGLRRRNMCTFVPSIVAIARPPDPAPVYRQRCAVMPDLLDDFVNASAGQLLKYQFSVTLHPDRLTAADSELQPLAWESIPYGHDEIHRVPDDKRGIYAFAINYPSDVLPPLSIGDLDAETKKMKRAFS